MRQVLTHTKRETRCSLFTCMQFYVVYDSLCRKYLFNLAIALLQTLHRFFHCNHFVSSPPRFHTLNATGINPYIERKSVVPALHACHFTWFMIHFVATICIFAIVLMQMLDRLSVAKEFNGKYSTVYKAIVIATWMIGAIFGSCVQLTGMSLMTKIQTTLHCVFAVKSLTLAYFCVYMPLGEDDQGRNQGCVGKFFAYLAAIWNETSYFVPSRGVAQANCKHLLSVCVLYHFGDPRRRLLESGLIY